MSVYHFLGCFCERVVFVLGFGCIKSQDVHFWLKRWHFIFGLFCSTLLLKLLQSYQTIKEWWGGGQIWNINIIPKRKVIASTNRMFDLIRHLDSSPWGWIEGSVSKSRADWRLKVGLILRSLIISTMAGDSGSQSRIRQSKSWGRALTCLQRPRHPN